MLPTTQNQLFRFGAPVVDDLDLASFQRGVLLDQALTSSSTDPDQPSLLPSSSDDDDNLFPPCPELTSSSEFDFFNLAGDHSTFFDGDFSPDLDFSPLTDFSISPDLDTSPLFGGGDDASLFAFVDDSPPVRSYDEFEFEFADMPLFGPSPALFGRSDPLPPDPTPMSTTASPSTSPTFIAPSLTNTPHLAPTSSTFASLPLPPASPAASLRSTASTSRRTKATGHRKGVSTEDLLGLDAPTQARTYQTESATSRRAIPAAFEGRVGKAAPGGKKKRKASEVEDEVEEGKEGEPAGSSLQSAIETKRRQNTLAARRSRVRKLEHVKGLESLVNILQSERSSLLAFARTALDLHPDLAAHFTGVRALQGGVDDAGMSQGELDARKLMLETFGPEDD